MRVSSEFLRLLRYTIADLYSTPTHMLILASDARLDVDRLNTVGSPEEVAYRIVQQALDEDKLLSVLARMQSDYPTNPGVQELAMSYGLHEKKAERKTT